MNTYKAILDTRRPNGVIATITQFDNATLSLQIVTNGEIEQPWEAPQFELIAMKRDQQAVRESDQAAFTINDAGEHRVTVDLKEQFLTCRGSVKMQFIVKDGDRLSTSIFYVMVGESLDHDIIESHRDVAVLDELESYVKQGFDDLAYQEQRMKDVEKATHELNELMVGNEAERQAAEANRQALFEGNESQRQNTFNQQLTSQRREFEDSQADREGTFNALKQSLSSDFNAAQNEREREFDRVMASNQTQFNDAETSRATTFSHRQLENERTFTANENARQTLFNANEAGRQTNEAERVSNENTRKTNEAERVTAEANRQQKMSEFETKATQLSDELDAQVARVDAFVSANEEKLLGDRDKVDYMGNTHESVKAASDANVDWLLGEMNTAHYEGQHITATETIEGRSKSAILKGQTLVNISNINKFSLSRNERLSTKNKVQVGKTYLQVIAITKNTLSPANDKGNVASINDSDGVNNFANDCYRVAINETGILKKVYTVTSTSGKNDTSVRTYSITTEGVLEGYEMLIEYQEGMENWDIPYFDGMQSVKMPVLTTTGKNLFDVSKLEGLHENIEMIPNGVRVKNMQIDITRCFANPFKENTQYTFSFNHTQVEGEGREGFRFYYTDGTSSYAIPQSNSSFVGSSSPNKTIKSISLSFNNNGVSELTNIQLEEGAISTTYEPHKTNILTVNEDVTLRGIGDVQDTLDCLTGEVTQRVGEVIIDGSQTLAKQSCDDENYYRVGISLTDMKIQCDTVNNLLPSQKAITAETAGEYVGSHINTNTIHIRILSSRLSERSNEAMKQFLQSNPIRVQYQLATESIKTVDLSDNHVYSYKDVTHYDCSSAEDSLVPTLSIDVPTNLPAVVARQRVTIQELEKENVALKNEIEETANSSVNGDLELMSSQFELDFRLFEIEMNLDMPMMATMRGVKSMAMTVYQQAKTLILAGKYEREDMEYKLNRYKAAGRITVEEYDELIALMDARELVD